MRTLNEQLAIALGYEADFEHDWAATGPLIEEHKTVIVYWPDDGNWSATSSEGSDDAEKRYTKDYYKRRYGATPLEAVCKHLVDKLVSM